MSFLLHYHEKPNVLQWHSNNIVVWTITILFSVFLNAIYIFICNLMKSIFPSEIMYNHVHSYVCVKNRSKWVCIIYMASVSLISILFFVELLLPFSISVYFTSRAVRWNFNVALMKFILYYFSINTTGVEPHLPCSFYMNWLSTASIV